MISNCEVFVRLPWTDRLKSVVLDHGSSVADLLVSLSSCVRLDGESDYYVLQNGSIKHSDDEVSGNVTFDLRCRLRGGKGGFGSMLRAIGAQIEKTTNREACRDLSGRRLRAINDERRARHYARLKAQREIEREQRRKKKLESLANSKPHHEFNDEQYLKDRQEIPESVEQAVEQALAEAPPGPSGSKGPAEKKSTAAEPKKIKGWMGDLEGFEDSDSDSEKVESDPASSGSETKAASV